MNENKKKYICREVKDIVLKNQQYKCANSIKDYKCLLWIINNGYFDEAGYQFDHINEYCLSSDNGINNIQALCPNCHAVKTKRFMQNKKIFSTFELDNGSGIMQIDNKNPMYISDDSVDIDYSNTMDVDYSNNMDEDYSNDCYINNKNKKLKK